MVWFTEVAFFTAGALGVAAFIVGDRLTTPGAVRWSLLPEGGRPAAWARLVCSLLAGAAFALTGLATLVVGLAVGWGEDEGPQRLGFGDVVDIVVAFVPAVIVVGLLGGAARALLQHPALVHAQHPRGKAITGSGED